MVRIWRQGDVVVREIAEIPRGAVLAETTEVRIASETGNPHVLSPVQVFETQDARSSQQRGECYVLLDEASTMTHPEHAPLQLLPGMYEITTVRDYAPARRLLD